MTLLTDKIQFISQLVNGSSWIDEHNKDEMDIINVVDTFGATEYMKTIKKYIKIIDIKVVENKNKICMKIIKNTSLIKPIAEIIANHCYELHNKPDVPEFISIDYGWMIYGLKTGFHLMSNVLNNDNIHGSIIAIKYSNGNVNGLMKYYKIYNISRVTISRRPNNTLKGLSFGFDGLLLAELYSDSDNKTVIYNEILNYLNEKLENLRVNTKQMKQIKNDV